MTSQKIYHNNQWNPEAMKVAEKLIQKIHSIAPELEATFMGSVSLKISGRNDLDIDILCPAAKLQQYKSIFEKAFGPALTNLQDTEYWKFGSDEVYWEFEQDGFVADIMLHDPNTTHFIKQVSRQRKLAGSTALREKYQELKKAADGLPSEEYERRKLIFFETVVDTWPE